MSDGITKSEAAGGAILYTNNETGEQVVVRPEFVERIDGIGDPIERWVAIGAAREAGKRIDPAQERSELDEQVRTFNENRDAGDRDAI